jgi:hypothetical protein
MTSFNLFYKKKASRISGKLNYVLDYISFPDYVLLAIIRRITSNKESLNI